MVVPEALAWESDTTKQCKLCDTQGVLRRREQTEPVLQRLHSYQALKRLVLKCVYCAFTYVKV
jgi:hypothetical protein